MNFPGLTYWLRMFGGRRKNPAGLMRLTEFRVTPKIANWQAKTVTASLMA
jgi:hypothetical protein